MIRIPTKKILKKTFRTILLSNFTFLFTVFYSLKILFLIQIIFDFIFTLYSVYIAKYAIELNPLVVAITPFGALILNLILWYSFRKLTIINWLVLLVLNSFYFMANRNHILIVLDLFATGALSSFYWF